MTEEEVDVYVSYPSEAREVVGAIVERLKDAGIHAWWDSALVPGDEWRAELNRRLSAARVIVVFAGERGLDSDYQLEETFRAMALEKPVIPVRLPGFPGFDRIPRQLREVQWLDYEKADDAAFEQLLEVLSKRLGEKPQEEPDSFDWAVAFEERDALLADELAVTLRSAGVTVTLLGADQVIPAAVDGKQIDHIVALLPPDAGPGLSLVVQGRVHAVAFTTRRPRPRDYPALAGKEIPQLPMNSAEGLAEILLDPVRLAEEGRPRCPWPGFEAHSLSDPLVFGRSAELAAIREKLTPLPRVAILEGPARSGKTSLVAALWNDEFLQEHSVFWQSIITFDEHAGDRLRETGELLRESPRHGAAFLVVDAFERVLEMDPAVRDAVVDDLLDLVEADAELSVLLVARSEALERILGELPRLAETETTRLPALAPMGKAEMREAILGPADEFDLKVEPDLVEALVDDVQALELPLEGLSITMKALWEERRDGRLELQTYERLGRAAAIVAAEKEKRKAEETDRLRRVLAGYRADSVDTVDKLDIQPVVRAFCSVMLSQQVKPPLSIGLFGDWGSGKSFFMEEMQRQVEELAKAAREGHSEDWHGHVAQIRFNAWHYSDANLWASFVTHIFDELAEIINPGETQQETRARLLGDLETSRQLADQAAFDLDEAQRARKKSKDDLEQQREDLRRKRDRLSAIEIGDLQALFEDPEVQESPQWQELKRTLSTASEELGIARAAGTVTELGAAAEQARTIAGKLRGLWTRFRGPSRGSMIRALVILGLPTLVGLAVPVVEWIATLEIVQRSTALVTAAIGQALFVAGVLARHLPGVLEKIGQLETVYARVEERARAREQSELAPARAAVDTATAAVVEAEEALGRAERRVGEAEQALQDASAGRQLYRFIEERSASESYRQHLGLISHIHRDFQELGGLLENCRKYVPDAEKAREGERGKQPPVARIDRIILYIDDLDRCKPQLVVEVLQAVHLLLALPLFVVVVGVDSRWLLRALEVHYPDFLSMRRRRSLRSGGQQAGATRKRDRETENHATTPQNYLEKIFQIPFCLPGMEETGFGNLVDHLVRPAAEPGPPAASPGAAREPQVVQRRSERPAPRDAGIEQEPGEQKTEESDPKPAPPPDPRQGQKPPVPPGDLGKQGGGPAGGGPPPPPLPSPRTVSITDEEIAFMRLLYPLVRTPRSTKRFVNIYRLLRAISVADEKAFLAGDFRPVLTLLALNLGDPYIGGLVLRELGRRRDRDAWAALVDAMTPSLREGRWANGLCAPIRDEEAADWKRIATCLRGLDEAPRTLERYKAWAPAITRFAFWPPEETAVAGSDA